MQVQETPPSSAKILHACKYTKKEKKKKNPGFRACVYFDN